MFRKLVILAITTSLAAKAYSAYVAKRDAKATDTASAPNGVRRAV